MGDSIALELHGLINCKRIIEDADLETVGGELSVDRELLEVEIEALIVRVVGVREILVNLGPEISDEVGELQLVDSLLFNSVGEDFNGLHVNF